MTDTLPPDLPQDLRNTDPVAFYNMTSSQSPHGKALGITVVAVSPGVVDLETPFDPKMVGDPKTGVVHGGVITSILDANSGMAVGSLLKSATSVVTLDLRIDYMKPSTPNKTIRSRAHCYNVTKTIAFVRAVAYHDDIEHPIATSVATFMMSAAQVGTGHAEQAGEAADNNGTDKKESGDA